jgi:hypothetical protein
VENPGDKPDRDGPPGAVDSAPYAFRDSNGDIWTGQYRDSTGASEPVKMPPPMAATAVLPGDGTVKHDDSRIFSLESLRLAAQTFMIMGAESEFAEVASQLPLSRVANENADRALRWVPGGYKSSARNLLSLEDLGQRFPARAEVSMTVTPKGVARAFIDYVSNGGVKGSFDKQGLFDNLARIARERGAHTLEVRAMYINPRFEEWVANNPGMSKEFVRVLPSGGWDTYGLTTIQLKP